MLDDFFNFTTTTTEKDTEKDKVSQTFVEPQTYVSSDTASNAIDYDADYSIRPNYEEQTGYESSRQTVAEAEQSAPSVTYRPINAPLIQRTEEEQAVKLTKSKQVVRLSGRMKIVATMFAVIMVALISAIVWNFVRVGALSGELAEKQLRVNQLEMSISDYTNEYNRLVDDGTIREGAENSGFVEADESNTVKVKVGQRHERREEQSAPSNWFNDVCDFLTKLFS